MDYPLNLELLAEVNSAYGALEGFRRQRQRCKRYAYGDQWGDPADCQAMQTEEEVMRQHGYVPLKNNLIRRLVRNVIGLYSTQRSEPVCVARDKGEQPLAGAMTRLLRYNGEVNRLSALHARSLEEFLISGLVAHRKYYGRRQGRDDCWTDYVSPETLFMDAGMRDFRGWDCRLIGEMHDCTLDGVCARLARDGDESASIRSLYGDKGHCRVIEAWRRESRSCYRCYDPVLDYAVDLPADKYRAVEDINARRAQRGDRLIEVRWVTAEVWRYYFLTPDGHVLRQGDTPYAHGAHPYVVKGYPLIDGEIHSFVADVIDQQRYANRLITLYDWIVRTSARGILMIPEDCVPRGVSPSEFAESWTRYDGMILYHPSQQGNTPEYIHNQASNVGVGELLRLQLGFFEDISGVNSALQGKLSSAATSGELFGQQTQNAATTLRDVLDTYGEFVRDGAYKDAKNISQYYTAAKVRRITGQEVDLAALDEVEYDLSVRPNLSTPASRQQTNDTLLEIWRSGQISLEQMLEAGDFPFADKLINANQ